MALMSKKNSSSCSTCCQVSKWVVCVFLFIVTVAALVGVYNTHLLMGSEMMRLQFGSSSGSLAIVAFVLAVMAWGKQMACCMSTCDVCSK